MKLYEVSEVLNTLWSKVEDEDTDLEVLEDTIQSLEMEFSDKAEGIASMMQSLTLEAEAIKQEEQRLAARRKARENKAAWLKSYLEREMLTSGMNKIKTAKFTLNIQNNPPGVTITDPSKIPSDFWIQQEPQLDKKSLLRLLKEGQEIDGVQLHIGRSLRIK